MGRPTSCGINAKVSAIWGVNLRIFSSASRNTVPTSVLVSRLSMSFVISVSSPILRWYSAFTVYSSSFTLCSSSFVLCSSSFEACSSSLAACSSSLLVSSSSMADCRFSLVWLSSASRPVSCSRETSSRLISLGGRASRRRLALRPRRTR